ncbi:hypothetical protein CSV78_15200 [Sporosarcina sp. P16a]|uniref:nuclease-related domain-containing DEAD/DEAH box helicase n=1 Tax=unclassified Sporosarcina TaxID=2647733 RepID=UPI000C169D51|nr:MULTISPECIES: NERD domain-containing protein/DEAD/DEAH box helicase [unclassified Sporosarcina]PIC65914.1 hypothetical protein CSV78_15200 [Sporosarcina sp. P16a]PIC91981.1 hypothetical protein CSV70_12615 [Sporosarcina sp. P25]
MTNIIDIKVVENPNTREDKTDGEKYLLETLCSIPLLEGWTIYDQPVINSLHPDFILTHREKGIIVIEVKDWHLQPPQYKNGGLVLGTNKRYMNRNPVKQAMDYKELLLKYELSSYVEADETGINAYAMITPIVYFHKASRERALEFCGNPDPRKCLVWTKSDLKELQEGQRKFDKFPAVLYYKSSKFAQHPKQYMQKLVDNVEEVLRPSDYARGRKEPVRLTAEQQTLVPIKTGSIRRWGGVAGSGKTLILATKAAEAIKDGQRVLLLTFNITLRHYIRDLCSQQFGEGDRSLLRSRLTISHFHGFVKTIRTELGVQAGGNLDSVEEYMDGVMATVTDQLNEEHPSHLQYDTILIDEGQDFKGDWIRFLKEFYTKDGELLVMYDKAQSIYDGQGIWITDGNEIEGIGFRGQVGHLKSSHRLPQLIIHQLAKLDEMLKFESEIERVNEQGDLFTTIAWENIVTPEERNARTREIIQQILDQGISTIEDIAIITMKETTGVNVVRHLHNETRFTASHVYDLAGNANQQERRNEKWKFQPGKGQLKVCSYHSYKGWESSHVILLLESVRNEEQWKALKEALFISLTRVNSFSESRSFTCLNSCRDFDQLGETFK